MELLVTADDRTGAYETAAALADRGVGPVEVVAWRAGLAGDDGGGGGRRGVVVVDLATRHLSPGVAGDRVASLASAGRRGHKIDSTLRGNWPEELAALARDRPVLLVPALPELGRTCVGGVVFDHGRPVHEGDAGTDVRRRVTTSCPAELLRAAGVRDVGVAPDVEAARGWLRDPRGVIVADAGDGAVIGRLAEAWSEGSADVVLAGTSAVMGAAAGTAAPTGSTRTLPPVAPPVLVACGSVHPVARAQLAQAERVGIPVMSLADDLTARRLADSDALVLATEIPVGDVDEPLAVAAASALASGVAFLRRSVEIGALIVIGGDTAAAVLGSAAVHVHGSVTLGTAWATVDAFDGPVITRSGGFGGDGAIVDIVRATLHS